MGRPLRNNAEGAIEYFWPGEEPTSAPLFERCLAQLQHEAGIVTTIERPQRGGIFRSYALAQHQAKTRHGSHIWIMVVAAHVGARGAK